MNKIKYTIKLKLRLLAYGLFLFLFLVGFFALYFINDIKKNREAQDYLNLLSYKILEMRSAEKNFMIYETTSIDYFETGQSKYIREFKNSFTSTKEIIYKLTENKAIKEIGADYKFLKHYLNYLILF